jgi:hypothetical protein
MGAWTLRSDRQQFLTRFREHFRNLSFTFLKMPSGLTNRASLDQNVFSAEFIVRIASFRRVTVRLDAVMKIENLGRISERIVDLFFCPDIECAFGGFDMAAVSARGYRAVGVLG